jgi:hypothetical protein
MSIPDDLVGPWKAAEALAALLAKNIPRRDFTRVAKLLYEADNLMVGGILEQAVRARSAIRAHTVDRVVRRTAASISDAMDKMVRDLPDDAAPQMALELVVDRLTQMQPWFLELIMEDHNFRETHAAAVARRPAKQPTKIS